MLKPYPFDLLEDPVEFARYQGWSEEVYRDFLAFQAGEMSAEAIRSKYAYTVAILILDMTGFTDAAIEQGSLFSFLRIFDVQKVCAPVFTKYNALRIRTFADDFTVTFDNPNEAMDAALEIHDRVRAFNQSDMAQEMRAETCIGLGYGEVYRFGVDFAMGDEMNQTSKLGEDTADGFETLVTQQFYEAVKSRSDLVFEPRTNLDIHFQYYLADRKP